MIYNALPSIFKVHPAIEFVKSLLKPVFIEGMMSTINSY